MKGTVNKKLLLLISIIPIIFLIIILSDVSTAKQKIISTTSSKISNKVSPNNSLENSLKRYDGNSYTFFYPKYWIQNTQKQNNSTETIFQPSSNPNEKSYISIEILNAQHTSIDYITNIFKALHYLETPSEVNGIKAKKYSAILQVTNGKLHSIAYVFQKNQKVYFFKLEYIQPYVNLQLETQFNQVVNSFKLK